MERMRPAIGTAFILSALDFARRGGRFNPELLSDSEQDDSEGVAVLSGYGSDLEVVALGHSVDELCDQIVECFLAAGRPIRAGVCLADPATLVFTEGIESRLRASLCRGGDGSLPPGAVDCGAHRTRHGRRLLVLHRHLAAGPAADLQFGMLRLAAAMSCSRSQPVHS